MADCGSKRCKKTTLIVLISICLIAVLAVMGVLAVATNEINHHSSEDFNTDQATLRSALIFMWCVLVIGLGFYILGLCAVIKEHHCLLITFATFLAIGLVGRIILIISKRGFDAQDMFVVTDVLFLYLTITYAKQIKEERSAESAHNRINKI